MEQPIQPQAPAQQPALPPDQGGQMQQQQQAQPDMPPSGRTGQPYNQQILQFIEQHLQSLPMQQKQYLAHYMAPELAVILGIVIGQEAFDYFRQFADPSKTLTVTNKSNRAGESNPASQPQETSGHMGQQREPVQPQPQAKPPARSIMGR